MRLRARGRLVVVALAAGLAVRVCAAQAPDRLLPLQEAIARALEKSETLIIDRMSVDSAVEAVTGAKGAYDPVLEVVGDWRSATLPVNSSFSGAPPGEFSPTERGFETGATVQQLLPTGGSVVGRTGASRDTTDGSFSLLSPAYETSLGFEFRQPLLRDRKIDTARFAIRVANLEVDRTNAALRSDVADTVVAVERAYWRLVATQRAVMVREDAVRLADEQLSETQSRIESGSAPEAEISQPRAELERRRGDLFASREDVARAENVLKLLILDDTDDAEWSAHYAPQDDPGLPAIEVNVAAAMEQALASRSELDEGSAVIERRRAEYDLARNAIRPALDAFVSYDKFGLTGSANPAATDPSGAPLTIPPGMEGGLGSSYGLLDEDRYSDTRAGVVFRIPIGNRTARAAAAVASNFTRQAESELARRRKVIRAEVLNAASALETGSQRIEAARAAREAAEVQLTSERERYLAGLSTNFLVLTRQNDLAQARLDEISALTDYRAARISMSRAQGSLLDERAIQVDARTP